jgi:hypothetical protein
MAFTSTTRKVLRIAYSTTKHIPSNEVAVCCPESLQANPIKGEYANKKWNYAIELPINTTSATLRFIVNEDTKMDQEDIAIPAGEDIVHLADEDVSFPEYSSRYIHGVEALLNEDTDFSRRFIRANLDPALEYDVIVVGSGMGGGILSDQLSDLGLSVLVLEAGSVHLPSHVGNLPIPTSPRASVSYDNEPGSRLTKDVCMNLGGRSVYWSSVIPRMNPWDLEHWPSDIIYYLQRDGYREAERLFRKRTEYSDYERSLRARLEERLPDFSVSHLPRSYHQEMSWITARLGNPDERPTGFFSTAALLLNSLSYPGMTGGDNITINLNHMVTHVECNQRTVTAVVCEDLISHTQRKYQGKVIVLSAGATESPCIALRSDLNDQSGKIGVGLTDHQSAEIVFEVPRRSIQVTPRDQAKMYILPRSEVGNDDKFSCELAINWRFWDPHYEDDDLYRDRLPDDAPILSTIKFLFRNSLNDENYIRLGTQRPIVQVKPMHQRPFELEANALKSEVLDYLDVDIADSEQRLSYRESSETYHTGGSLRIGAYGQGVVDTDLRFHEYDNLYCCDLSVFPDIPTANPSLTLGALALRLANHIKQYA